MKENKGEKRDERVTVLTQNFQEYFSLAELALKQKSYNSATTLYFKALVALCDLIILRKEGFVPSSHTHRFRVIQENHPDLYEILDRDFPFYQDSYTRRMNREAAELLRNDTLDVKKKTSL